MPSEPIKNNEYDPLPAAAFVSVACEEEVTRMTDTFRVPPNDLEEASP